MASVADYFGEDDEELLYKKLNGDLNYKDIMKELDERIHKYYFERSVIVSNGSPQLRLDHIHDSTAASRRIFDAKHRAILLARNKVQHLNAYDLWARAMIRLIGEVDHPVFAMRVIKDSTKDAALSLVQEWGNRKEAACIQAWREDEEERLKSRKRRLTNQSEVLPTQKRKIEHNGAKESSQETCKLPIEVPEPRLPTTKKEPCVVIDLSREHTSDVSRERTSEKRKCALLKRDIEELRGKSKTLPDRHAKEISNFKTAEKKVETTTAELLKKQAELDRLTTKFLKKQAELNGLTAEVQALDEKNKGFKEQTLRASNALLAFNKESEKIREQIDLKKEILHDYERRT